MSKENQEFPWIAFTWGTVGLVSVIWWTLQAQSSIIRFVLVVSLSFAAFMVGCLVGFLFSSYGEENSIGKVRDWLIGAISALTVAKASSIKSVLLVFAAGPGPQEFGITVGAAVFYSGIGFFFMYYQRELILNVLLAKSRAERGKLEGSSIAGAVIQRSLVHLPASVLTGVDEVGDGPEDKESAKLKEMLYSDEVKAFLEQAEQSVRSGAVDWDVVSKCAYIYYYRTNFKGDEDAAEQRQAIEWITRALNMNPMHVDLTMKYAAVLGEMEEYGSAAAILHRLAQQVDAPILVRQWLGYYLRFIPDQLDESIRYSKEYHQLVPEETDSFFNVAYAYAAKYCAELRASGLDSIPGSNNRLEAISALRSGLLDQPEMKEAVLKWTQAGRPFSCLQSDGDFKSLLDSVDARLNKPVQ